MFYHVSLYNWYYSLGIIRRTICITRCHQTSKSGSLGVTGYADIGKIEPHLMLPSIYDLLSNLKLFTRYIYLVNVLTRIIRINRYRAIKTWSISGCFFAAKAAIKM